MMDKHGIIHRGNDSLAISAIWGVSAIAHPCPICAVSSVAFFVNGMKEKLVG